MNMTQLRVILQYAITAIMSYVVAKGWLPQDVATEVGAALLAALPALYSVWKSRNQGKIESAASVPGVHIVAPPTIANATAKPNVVSSSDNEVISK